MEAQIIGTAIILDYLVFHQAKSYGATMSDIWFQLTFGLVQSQGIIIYLKHQCLSQALSFDLDPVEAICIMAMPNIVFDAIPRRCLNYLPIALHRQATAQQHSLFLAIAVKGITAHQAVEYLITAKQKTILNGSNNQNASVSLRHHFVIVPRTTGDIWDQLPDREIPSISSRLV